MRFRAAMLGLMTLLSTGLATAQACDEPATRALLQRIDAAWDGECARFEHAGRHHSLRPQEPAAQPLHFVFGDATNGRDTYGGGRFLQADPPRAGRVPLDFNRAINPPCVFTPYATCPLPAPENRLPFAVSAGEKLPAAHP